MNPYSPQRLPINKIDVLSKLNLIIDATSNLVRYDEKLKVLPNPNIFLSPLQKKEAVKSSQIEGTRTTLDEVLQSEADLNAEVEDQELMEVFNYRDAMNTSIEELNNRPLNLNLVKNIHSILLDNVRGNDRGRGEFRREQVWIGAQGTTQNEAEYVPPVWEEVEELLDNWEKYIHTDNMNPLVQTAVMHAQFEIIHPFVDGNGRVGRILIPLYLHQKGLISQPMFYLSGYLEENREYYIAALSKISLDGNWDTWIDFFLRAVNEQAKMNLASVNGILALYERTKHQLLDTRSPYQTAILDALFMFPFFTSTRLANAANIDDTRTAIRIIKKLEQLDIVKKISEKVGSKPAMYVFPELYTILR